MVCKQTTAGQRVRFAFIDAWKEEWSVELICWKHKATMDSNHTSNIAPNLLDQDFTADGPNQKWAGDLSYIWTSEGWLYLAVILDLYSRQVIGWAVSNRMKLDLAIWALDMAVALRHPSKTAFIIRIVGRNIAQMSIRSACPSTASRFR